MEKGSHAKISQIMRVIRRCTAVFLILIFTLVDLLQYVPDSYANSALIATESALNSSLIPENMGRVEEVFRGSSGKTIYFIQDAHDSLEAQENIASMITKLVKDRGIKTVFEEGYEGLVPTDNFFGFIKNSKIKQKVSYFLLDKLRLSGAEYAHINRADDFKLIGVENLKLYGKNIEYYKEASKHREEVSKDLEALFTEISNLANQHFPGNLRALLKTNKRFSDDKLPLLNYLKKLQRFYQKSPLDNRAELFSKKYPSISILLTAETIAEPLLAKQLNEMDFKAVFSEILQLEQDISRAYLGAERDRKIFTYYQALQLLMKLNQIKLTPSEYEAVKKIFQDFDTKQLAEFVVSLTGRSLVLSKEWETNIESSALFYDIAQERDKTISHHMKSFFQSENESAAILVFGGFHASGIKEILREHQISYQVISPRINSFSKKHQGYYQHLMAGSQHSFEKPFMSARAARPPSMFFLAVTTGEQMSARTELRAIASSVEALGNSSDSQLIEHRLADFSAQQKLQSLEEVSISGVRSEMRTEAEGIKEIVEKAYGLHVNGVPEVLTGGLGKRMNHEPYVIKTRERGRLAFKFLFKDQERARYAVEFMQRLREFDLPVPELVPRLDVTVSDDPKDVYIMEYRDAFYVLETFLSEGSEILREDATEEHFREVGKLAARIQNAVEGFEPRHMFSYKTRRVVFEKIKDGFSEMEKAMDSLAVVHGPENELVRDALRRREQIRGLVETHLDYTGRNFPRSGLRFTHIHNDLHLGNLKFSKHGSISALFDFNLVQADHRIAEFNNLVFSITGYGFAVFRPEMFRAVLAGYEQTLNVPLTPEEKVAIWESLRLRFIQEVTRVYSTKPDAAESIFRDRDAKRGWYQSLDALMHFAPEPFIYDGRSVLEVGGTHHAGDKQRSEARGNRARDWEERPSIGKLWEFIKLLTINNWKIPEILPPENEEIDYIVAIGASISKDGSASTHSRAVAEQAVNLYRRYRAKGQIPKIIFSGGYSQNGVSEAESMRRIALTMEPGGASDFIKDRAPNLRLGTKTQFPAIFEAIEKDQSITGPRDKIINVIGVAQYLHSRRVISLLRYYLGLSSIKVWQSPAPKSEYEENSTQWQLQNPKKGFWKVIKFIGENRFFVWEVLNYFRYIQNARRLADEPKQMAEMRRLIIAAHRGGTPGNDTAQDISLEAVKKSVALGVDAVEFDVQMTRDGYIVSSHAEKLDGKAISSMTFAEVKALVPDISTIDDIYDVVKDSQARFHIHVVWTKNKLRKVFLQKLAHFLKEKEIVERSLIISFYPEDLQLMYQHLPELKRDRVFFKEELWEAIAKKQQDPQMLVKEAGKAKADYITWPRQVEPDAELIGELKKAGIGIDIGPKEEYLTVIDIQRYQNMGADILTILDPEWDPYAEDFGGQFQAKYPNKHIYPRARLAPRVAEQLSNSKYRQIYDLVAGLFGVEEDDDQARLLRGKRLLADVYASPNKEQFIEKTFEAAKVHTFVASSKQRFYPLMVIMGNLRKGRSLFSARTIDELPPNQDKNNPQEYLSTRHLVYAENPKGEDIPDLQLQSPVSFNGKDKIKMLDIGSAPKEHGSMPLNSLMRVFRSWGIEPEIHGTDQFFPVFKTNQEGDIVPESDYYFESDGSFLGKEGIRYWNTQKSPKANVLNNDFGLGKFDVITLSKVLHHLTVDKDTYAPKPLSTRNLIYSKENRIQGPFSELYGITETQQQVIDRLLDSLAEGGILFLNLSYALWPAGKENDQYKAAHRESLVDKNNSDTFIMIQRKDAHSFWIYDEVMPFRSELDSLSSLEMVFMQRKTIDEWFFGGDESQRPSETVFTRLSSQMEKDAELRDETEEIFRKADLLAYRHQRLNRSVWGQIFLSLEVRDQRKSLTDLLSKYLEYVPDKHPVKKDLLVRAQKLDHRMGTTGGIAGSVSSKHRSEVRGEPKEKDPKQMVGERQIDQQNRNFISTSAFKWLRVLLLVGFFGIAFNGNKKTLAQETEPSSQVASINQKTVPELIQDLSGDYDSNKIAMKRLVEIGDENVAELLVKLWRDRGYIGSKTFDAGEDAATVLVRIGKPAVGPLVKVLLNDEKWVNRGHAAELLGGIGDTEAVGALIEALNDEHDFVRDSAAEALGKIGDMRAFDSLIKALDDKEDEVRVSSAGSLLLMTMNNNFTELDHLDSEIFVPVLNDWDLDIEEKIAVTSYFILKNDVRVIPRLIGMLDHENPEVWEKAAEHLSSFGAPAAQALIEETMNRRSYYQKQSHDRALEILKKMGATAIEPIMQAYESGRKNYPRHEYLEILVESGDVRTYDFFIKILTKGEESDVQHYSYITAADAAEALGNIGDRRAVEALIKALSYKSHNDSTASHAAVALGKIGDSTSVEPLIKALNDYKLPAAAVALGKIGDPRAIEPLIKNLSSTDGYMREAARDALIAMSQYGTSERLKFWWADSPIITFVIGTLMALSGLYFTIFLIAQLVTVMGYLNISWAKSILRKGLKWKYDEYIDYFRKHRNGNGSYFFSDLLLMMLNVKSTIRALAFSRDNDAGPILIDWLLRGKDDIRKRAVEALGRLSDPNAQFYHAIYFRKIEVAAAVPGAQEFLQAAFEQKHNKEISRSAALAGAELKLKNFVPFLIDALADADPSYQALAVKGLGKIPAYEAHFYFYLYHKNFKKASLVPHAEKYIEKALGHKNSTVRETATWVSRELLIAGKLKSDKVMPGVAESMEDLIIKLNAAASQKRPDDAVLDNKLHRTHKVHFYAMPAEQAQRDALSRFSHNAFGKVGPLLATRQDGTVLPFIGDFFMVDEALQTQDGRMQLRVRKLDDEEIFRRYGFLKLRSPAGDPYEMEWHSLRDVVGRLSMLPGQFGWVERRGHNREIPIGNFSDIFNTIISGDQVHWQPARLEMKGFGTARIRAVHNVFDTATGKPIEIMPTLRSKVPTNLDFVLFDSDKKIIITNDFQAFLEMPGALSGTNYQPFFHSPPGLEEVDQSGREKQHAASVSRNGVSMPNHAFYHSTFLDRLNANRTYGVTIRMSKSENDTLRLRELLHEYDQFGSQSVLGQWKKEGIVFEKLKKFMYRMGLNVKGMNQSDLYLFPNGNRAEVSTEEHETDHYGEIIRTVYGTQVVGSGVGGLMQAQPAYDMVINNFSMNGDLADLGEYIHGGGTGDFAVQYLLHFLARLLADLKERGLISADEAHGDESRRLLAAYLEGVSPSIVHDKSYALMPLFPKPEMFELQSQTLPEMSTEYNEDGYSSETATGRYLKNFSVRITDSAVQKIMSTVVGGQSPGSSFKLPDSKIAQALQKVFQDFHGDGALMKAGLEQQYIALAMKFESVWQEKWPDLSQRSSIGQFKDLFLGIARAAMDHQFYVEFNQQKIDLPEAINQFNKLIMDIQRGSADWIEPEVQVAVEKPAAASNRSEVRGQEIKTKLSSVDDHKPSEMRVAEVKRMSERRANQVVRSIGTSAQPATVFVDAEDFLNLSEAQKQEYLFVAFSNKAVRVVVYNERGQLKDKELNALLKLERVERTDKDLERAAVAFSRMNTPAIHLSKHILPTQALVGSLHKKVAFFKANGNKSGTLATAILWAVSGGESVHFQGVKNENGFWTVADSLLNELQRVYENNFVFALAA